MKSKNIIKITPYEIAELFNKVYSRVASLEKGISGFKATGIFPINPAVFDDEDFIDNIVTEQLASVNRDIIQSTANETPLQALMDSFPVQTASNNLQK